MPKGFYTLPDGCLLPKRYKKQPIFLFMGFKTYNLKVLVPQRAVNMMSQDQVFQMIKENENLQAQVKELNEILFEREEELEWLKKNAGDVALLRSTIEGQLDEFHSMQNEIGERQQQVEGAAEREMEMEQELSGAAKLQRLYNELLQEYAYSQAQLNDVQLQLLELNRRNRILQHVASKAGETESELEIMQIERDELRSRILLLENKHLLRDL